MEIVQERLEREYDLDLITTAPTVAYRVKLPSAGRHAGGSAAAAAAAAVAANAPLPPSAASSGGATGEGVVKGASGASTASQLVVINNDAIDDPLLVAVDNPASVPVRSLSISGKLKEREKVGRTPPPPKKKPKNLNLDLFQKQSQHRMPATTSRSPTSAWRSSLQKTTSARSWSSPRTAAASS